jgi:hypothetical protein
MINYLKKLYPILYIAFICAMIAHFLSMFMFQTSLFGVSVLAGVALVFYQSEVKSYKFLDKLIIGSVVYGFFVLLLMINQMYFASLAMRIDMPYSFFYSIDLFSYITLVGAVCFISFMGGLAGIVGKGFYILYHNTPKIR